MQKQVYKKESRSPRLDTILMVEETLQNYADYPTKTDLWHALPRKVMWSTFNTIIKYLEKSNKIIINESRLVWIEVDDETYAKLIKDTVDL